MSESVKPDRLSSLDAFRGFTIAGMILVNNPGTWAAVHPPLLHAEWHGWTPTDLIFPFFLFIVGVSMAFSLSRRLATGRRSSVVRQIVRRSAILLALGLLLNLFPDFDLDELRMAGVLQRIAGVYLVAALLVVFAPPRSLPWITGGILLGYWALLSLVPVPGHGAGVLTPDGNIAAWIDRLLLPGRLWQGTWDPEGLLSTVPAVATTLLGYFTGLYLRSEIPGDRKSAGMFTAGWILIAAGLAWHLVLPINKNLWTSSYVLFTAGAALEGLAFCYWLIDVRGRSRWALPAIAYGLNPITVFFLSGLLADLLRVVQVPGGEGSVSLRSWLYSNLFASWLEPADASLAFAVTSVLMWCGVAAVLYRRRIFIKI